MAKRHLLALFLLVVLPANLAVPSSQATAFPDLVPTALSLPAAGTAGRPIELSWRVQNQGDAPAVAEWGPDDTGWRDGVYFSTDATLDGQDTPLGSLWWRTTLQPGTIYTQTLTVRLPGVPSGDYFLLLQVDVTGRIAESSEANNLRAAPLTVRVPDLAPTAVTLPPAGVAGRLINVSWEVQNAGDGPAIPEWGGDDTGWRNDLYFSTDAVLDPEDVWLGNLWKQQSVLPGKSYTQTLDVRLPGVPSGDYFLLLQVDQTGRVYESSEANNLRAAPLTVRVPDLAPAILIPPRPGPGGRWVSVSWTVRNDGGGAAIPEWGPDNTGWRDGLYFSGDATLDGEDLKLGWLWKQEIVQPGAAYTRTLSVALPAVPVGEYYLLLQVDETSRVYESTESNNSRAVPITIAVPDLAPAALSAPAEVVTGGPASVSWIVRNQGIGEAGAAWVDRLYLSPDGTWDPGDVQLGPDFSHDEALAGQASAVRSAEISLPAVPPGSYTLIVRTDAAGHVNEADEANNEMRRPLRVRPAAGPGTTLALSGWGPRTISPGQTVDYLVGYINEKAELLEDLIVVAELPIDGDYVSNTGGGVYWPERHQVVWKAGDAPPGEGKVFSVRVTYAWGLPGGRQEAVVAVAAAQNLANPAIAWAQYQAFTPLSGGERRSLSPGEVSTLLASDPELAALVNHALSLGFRFDGEAFEQGLSDGSQWVALWLLDAGAQEALAVTRHEGVRLITRYAPNAVTLMDAGGGLTWRAETETAEPWGTWSEPGAAISRLAGAVPPGFGKCLSNCFIEELPASILGELVGAVGLVFAGRDCWRCAREQDSDSCLKCAAAASQQAGLGVAIDAGLCRRDCAADPGSHICSSDVRYCPADNPFWQGLIGVNYRGVKPCNTQTGRYEPVSHYLCGPGERCLEGACLPESGPDGCQAEACAVVVGSTVAVARDPNAKHGPAEVLPGELLTYTIEYENEGQGIAYGVFVEDTLPAALDANTLAIGNGGVYLPSSRTLVWTPGEVQPGGGGSVSFSARVPPAIVSGTAILNVATVFFPSVPEETPTNPIVTIARPVIALPQTVETTEGVPVAITLSGRAVGSAPLSYELLDGPRNGTLVGTLPAVTYTPAPGFEGPDRFDFAVRSGAIRSLPAEVAILVQTGQETEPPEVVATVPENGATGVPASATPLFSNVYPPFVWAMFSEPLRATTITTQTLFVVDDLGARLPGLVLYDEASHSARFQPQQPLRPGAAYTVTLTASILDTSGNPLARPYRWTFHTQGSLVRLYLPVVVKKE